MHAAVSSNNSTTVRSYVAPWALRAGITALGAVAPPLAERAVERIFLTPPRHAAPPQEREVLASADRFTVPFGRGRLQAWRSGEGPAVMLVHGWGGRGGQMMTLAPALRRAGCSVVTFDGPAHGASSGRIASAPLFGEAIAAVAGRVGARAAVAHSMGAPGLAVALAGGLALDAAVFVAPPRSPLPFFQRLCDAMRVPSAIRQGARSRLERRFGTALADLDLRRIALSMTTPLLVIHDRADREVDWTDGAAIAEAWPGAVLATTEGLGHRRILRHPEAVQRVAAFVVRHLGRCACGRLASEDDGTGELCATCALERELFHRVTREPRAA